MKYQDFKHFCTEHLLTWGLHSDHFVELSSMLVAHESLGKIMRVIELIKTEEAFRAKPYYCTAGMPTIGYGRVVGKKGDPLPDIETTPQAESDFVEKEIKRLKFKLVGIYPNAWGRCNEVRQAVLISMAYQLGLTGLAGFRHMWAAIEKGDWKEASTQMLDSLAARQTPARWKRNAYMMETGIIHNYYK